MFLDDPTLLVSISHLGQLLQRISHLVDRNLTASLQDVVVTQRYRKRVHADIPQHRPPGVLGRQLADRFPRRNPLEDIVVRVEHRPNHEPNNVQVAVPVDERNLGGAALQDDLGDAVVGFRHADSAVSHFRLAQVTA
uniref:(northern house mosquito) hypothetical protein n=1 Tax=Culex pipiens TaxID=7175 RepID=A0A8D8F7Y9_CULPI